MRRTLTLVLGLALLASASLGGGHRAQAAYDPVAWVDDLAYGSRGGGFYHDFTSGQNWTAERGWHVFSPQPPRTLNPALWADYLTYGSVGRGFYLDPLSGQVWTAERGWHAFSPGGAPAATPPPPAAPTPQPTPTPDTRPLVRIGATCRDGTHSNATGSGACSSHGGVAEWLYGRP